MDKDILNSCKIENIDFVYVSETDSTNNLAKKLAYENCVEWTVVACDSQTKGRGRLGREWIQAQKEGIYMSVVLRPECLPEKAPLLTLVAGISVCEAINEITGLKSYIKWPNDVIINNKKVAGILTEMSVSGENVAYAVVGIGVNLNQNKFSKEISDKATSIFLESKKNYRRNTLIWGIINKLEKNYNIFCENGFGALRQQYLDRCMNIGKYAKAIRDNQEICGVVVDVNEKGEIVIETKNNKLVNIASGEVSLRAENNNYI